ALHRQPDRGGARRIDRRPLQRGGGNDVHRPLASRRPLTYLRRTVYAALAIFGAVLSTLIVPLPEELALLGAGWWAHAGALPLWGAWVAAWLAIVVGDTASYLIGRSFLPRLLQSRFGKRLVAPDLRRWGEDLVHRHGFRAILLGAFSLRSVARSTWPSAEASTRCCGSS